MKKLHKLILRSYLGPFVLTFCIALFILLMQFVWKYVDDFVGKGLEWYVIVELLFYASASFVPMALPLAILLSSIMTMGNFGEHSELTACKSSGISLQKVMRPLVIVSIILSGVAFYFSNVVLPMANLKFGSLLYDVRQQKPAFALKAGIFYSGLEGYSIKVGNIEKDGKTLNNIMIYDHTENLGNTKLITAKSGSMDMADNNVMLLKLYNGNSFEEVKNQKSESSRPFQRSIFKESVKRFDMAAYKFTRTDEELFKDNYQMLDLAQLGEMKDTAMFEIEEEVKRFENNVSSLYYFGKDSLFFQSEFSDNKISNSSTDYLLQELQGPEKQTILESAIVSARTAKQMTYAHSEDMEYRMKSIVKYNIEFHRKFTLSIACLILFFIGAPLGAIIRKGGLGLPVFMATVFFIFYHLVSITGEKFAKESLMSVPVGMWLASVVLLPVGLFLTIKATTDSALFDINAYLSVITKPFKRKK